MSDRRTSFVPLDPSRSALLVIDMQVGFLDEGEPVAVPGALGIVPRINTVAQAVRAAGGLVAHTRHTIGGDPSCDLPPWERAVIPDAIAERFAPGAAPHAIHPSIDVGPADLVVDKRRYSGLAPRSSTLQAELSARGVDTLMIAGVMTNVCCESTARDGHSLDYRVLFLADATATADPAAQIQTLRTLQAFFAWVIDSADLIALLAENMPSVVRAHF